MSNTRDVYTMHVLHMRINNFVILLSWKRTEHVKHFQSEHIYCCACVLRKCVMCLCVSVCVWVCVGVLCKQLIFIKEVVQNLLHACARHAVFSIPHPPFGSTSMLEVVVYCYNTSSQVYGTLKKKVSPSCYCSSSLDKV